MALKFNLKRNINCFFYYHLLRLTIFTNNKEMNDQVNCNFLKKKEVQMCLI